MMAPCWYSPCWDLEPQNREVLGSNPMVCSWKSCSASAVESDLGVPTPCQVGSTVVLQEKKRKKKKRTTTTTKLRRAGAALLRGAAAEVETRDYKEKQSWSSSHRKSITRECKDRSWKLKQLWKSATTESGKGPLLYGHKTQKHFNRWVLQSRPAHGEYTISLAPWQ